MVIQQLINSYGQRIISYQVNKSCTINDFKCQGLTLRWDCLIENVFFADQAREGKKLSFTVFLLFELYKERGWRSLFAGNQNLFLKSYFVHV